LLTVQDAQGRTETITCTAEHPYWVPGRGWTAAADLTAGTELTSPDGSMVVVVSNTVQVLAEPVNVYNFQVDGDHTYFVDDGAEPVWVHNICGPAGEGASLPHPPGPGLPNLASTERSLASAIGSQLETISREGRQVALFRTGMRVPEIVDQFGMQTLTSALARHEGALAAAQRALSLLRILQ